MNKNVCIIHFNTPVLTAHLVKSINKHTPGTNIYIFDNSDKMPFINTFDNVTIFDNTRGQIINFDQWLKKYPNRDKSGGKANKWGSAKHAYSVEKCMELIKEPFVLFDSDVLVKNDFSLLFDDIVCYKGEVINQPGTNNRIKRVLPFICYINTPMCFQKGIHYFDENYMHGLRYKGSSDNYDTGGALYILTEKKKGLHREIKVSDYIVHYGNGSWVDAAEKMRKPKHIPAMEWLNKYKDFWDTEFKKTTISNTFESVFDHIYCLHYLPDADRLPKLKSELSRVGIDENADYFSWKYDYPSPLLDLTFKNLNMDTALTSSSRPYIKRVSLKHYEIMKEALERGYKRILIMEDDIRFHNDLDYIGRMLENLPDTDIVMLDKMVSSSVKDSMKYKEYVRTLPEGSLYADMPSNIFFIFASCYVLNETAMKHIVALQEEKLLPPDTPFNDSALTGSFAVINVAIQDPELKTIKNEGYDKIGLDLSQYKKEVKIEPVRNAIPVAKKPVKPTRKAIKPARPEGRPRTILEIKESIHKKTMAAKKPKFKNSVSHNRLYDVI